MPGPGRPFVKGTPKKGGRKKGTPNKKTVELNFLTRMAPFIDGEAYTEALKARVLRGKAPHAETYLYNRLHGRPADATEEGSEPPRPIKVVIEVVRG